MSTDTSVVEFSKAELATANPAPTVTISSSGGAQLVFDSSGNLWMVTGGGPDCFGTPCTNEVLEFTKAQLSISGSPTPAVTISSTNVGTHESLDGPYSLAFTSSGDLWVENFDGNTAVEFGKDQLAAVGVAHAYPGHRWPKNRDELALLCRHRAVSVGEYLASPPKKPRPDLHYRCEAGEGPFRERVRH